MKLWYLSYVHSKTNRFAGAIICDGGDRCDDAGLLAAAQTAYDLGIAPGRHDVDAQQYQVSGKPVPAIYLARLEPHRDRLLSFDELRALLPEFDWKRLADHQGRN